MERTGPHARFAGVVAAFAAALLAAGGLTALAPSAVAADTELARNGGFESGLDGWSCSGGSGAAVGTPAHGGTSALKATPAGSDNAKCSRDVIDLELPDEEDRLRLLRHPRDTADAARADDVVDQLGPVRQRGVLEELRRLLRQLRPSGRSSIPHRNQLPSTSSGQ